MQLTRRLNYASRTVWFIFALALFAVSSKADSTYTYTGNPYNSFPVPSSGYTGANNITVNFEVGSPLLANETYAWGDLLLGPGTATDTLEGFSESDGIVSYSGTTVAEIGLVLYVTTNSSGQIATWFAQSCGTCGSTSIFLDSDAGIPAFGGVGFDGSTLGPNGTTLAFVGDSPGTWVESTTSVPEPSSLLLLCIGMLGVVGPGLKKNFLR